jgi:uncharacterized protein YkwD
VPLKRLLAGGSAALVAGALFHTTPASASSSTCWNDKPAERAFARKMNRARSSLAKLRLDPELSKVARAHTRAMTGRNLLFHSSTRQLGERVTRWRLLGENIGYGSTVRSLHRAFMASAPHRANIRRAEFRNVGVGVRRRSGHLWVTVIFQSRSDPGTTLSMPSC